MKGPVKYRSAGIVVVYRVNDQWQVLLLRAYRHWDFPKGLIEPGETPLVAARRETTEETGLTGLDFHWGTDSIETEMYGDHKIATFFLAVSPTPDVELPVNPQLGHPEHVEYRWVPIGEARTLLSRRLLSVIDWAIRKLPD